MNTILAPDSRQRDMRRPALSLRLVAACAVLLFARLCSAQIGTITLISPANGSTFATTTPTLQWAAYPNTVLYYVYVQDLTTMADVFIQSTANTQITVSPALQTGRQYSWDVLAYNSSVNPSEPFIGQSADWLFTVASAPPALSINKTHVGNFTQGQAGAMYTVTVSNAASAGPTSGLVTVTETIPAGLTLVSMAGTGWACTGNVCTRSDVLAAGASYPPITVTVNVAATAPSTLTNAVSVSGGGSASANGTSPTTIVSSSLPFSCVVTSGATPSVRADGYTELVGDILITCSGGSPLPAGSPIPTANITLFLNTAVTSRLLPSATGVPNGSSSASEALLLVNEPGSSTLSGYGPAQSQNFCGNPSVGAGPGGCAEWVGQSGATLNEPVSGSASSTTPGANVFQGVTSGNQVTFYGIPVQPPVVAGETLEADLVVAGQPIVYRITNVRANANGVTAGGGSPDAVIASLSTSLPALLPIPSSTVTVGFVQQGLSLSSSGGTGLRNSGNTGALSTVTGSAQCSNSSISSTISADAVMQFQEQFATAFKVRQSGLVQNIPGTIYNSESGFIAPYVSAASSIAGLADYGTRLKATFHNVPAGVSVFVSTRDIVSDINGGNASGYVGPQAELVASESASDGANGFGPVLAPAAGTYSSSAPAITYAPVAITAGSGMAVWEVINTNPNAIDTIDFGLYLSYPANAPASIPAPGSITVTLSYAPTPAGGAFTSTAGASSSTLPLPRFSDSLDIPSSPCYAILTASLPNGTQGASYNAALSVTGGIAPYTWSATGLPTGLTVSNVAPAAITGTPTIAGTYSVFLTVTDSSNPKLSATTAAPLALIVIGPGLGKPSCVPSSNTYLPGANYSATCSVSGGTPPISWTFTNLPGGGSSAPTGASVSVAGVLPVTVPAAGFYTINVSVKDNTTGAAQTTTITIAISLPTLPVPSCPAAASGTFAAKAAYSATCTESGGAPPYAWSYSWSSSTQAATSSPPLPPWLTANTSVAGQTTLSGTVPASPPASYTVTVTATDSSGQSKSTVLTINVAATLQLSCTLAIGPSIVGVPYSAVCTASGGASPYAFSLSAGSLPSGLKGATSAATYTISGNPTAAASYTYTVQVTDSSGQSATQLFSGAVSPTPAVSTFTLATVPSVVNQYTTNLTLSSAPPVALSGTLCLTFTANSSVVNAGSYQSQEVVFANGTTSAACSSALKTTLAFTVPAGGTAAVWSGNSSQFSEGTVAGTITVVMNTLVDPSGNSVLPNPSPTPQSITVPLGAPAVTVSPTISTTSNSVTVVFEAVTPTREVTGATFTFNPGAMVISVSFTSGMFSGDDQIQWFGTAASLATGGSFSLSATFSCTNCSALTGATVTLTN